MGIAVGFLWPVEEQVVFKIAVFAPDFKRKKLWFSRTFKATDVDMNRMKIVLSKIVGGRK